MSHRLIYGILIFVVLGVSSPAAAIPPPIHVSLASACEGDVFHLQVWVDNWSGETIYVTVRRTESAPDMLGESILVENLESPSENQPQLVVLPDPGLGPQDIGFYEAVVTWPDGSEYATFSEQLSCSEEPYLMRGWLLGSSTFQPCTELGLLECDTVTLLYGEMNEYVGTNELLEIYGWLEDLHARDDCWVTVVAIESLGGTTTCEDVVGVSPSSWDAIKACYR